MKIAIGCDNAAVALKNVLKKHLESLGHVYVDCGVETEEDKTYYPAIAEKVALAVRDEGCERGILVCGTGIGMAITANKVPGVLAALCHDVFSAERAIKSNNAQIITMGARVIGPELAKTILTAWLNSTFVPGPSSPKIDLMHEIDKKYRK